MAKRKDPPIEDAITATSPSTASPPAKKAKKDKKDKMGKKDKKEKKSKTVTKNMTTEEPEVDEDITATDALAAKKAKQPKEKKDKNKKTKRTEEDEGLFDLEKGINTSFVAMDPALTADYVGQKMKRNGADLSEVELGDLRVSSTCITDTSSFEKPRIIDNLPDFMEEFKTVKYLNSAGKEKGSPHTIIVSVSGLRAANVVRAVRQFEGKKTRVTKCFAKHIKISETVKFLSENRISVAVGTPIRLADLLDNGALKIDEVQHMIIDASFIDEKKRGVLDMRETILPLCKWLSSEKLRKRYEAGEKAMKVMFF